MTQIDQNRISEPPKLLFIYALEAPHRTYDLTMYDELNRYRALLQSQTDERVCKTLREMIREIEERMAAARERPCDREGSDD
jgi:hypothetical protein